MLEEFSSSRMSTVELNGKHVEYLDRELDQCCMPEIKLLVQIKAHSVYEDLLQDSDNAKSFDASSGWFCNFTKRCNFCNINSRGESALSDTVTVELFVKELQHRIKKKKVIHLNNFEHHWECCFLAKDAF